MTALVLLNILDDLKPDEFANFKWSLKYEKVGDIPPIKEYRMSNAERRDVVDLMVQHFEFAGAVEVMKNVLKKISKNYLVMKLPTIISGAEDQEKVLDSNALPTGKHLSVSQTNLPQISEPIDQSSTKHSQAVKERIAILEKTSLTHKELQVVEKRSLTHKGLQVVEKRSLTHKGLQVVEKQYKLVEDEFRRAHHPKVKILCGVNSVILEGPDKEVQLAETKLEELMKQLKEKRVKLSAALITFMTSSGVISKYQTRFQRSLRSPVALEVGSDLVLSSLSSAALDEAETAVLRDLSEIKHSKNLHPQRDEVQKNISDKNRQAEGADEKLVDHRTTQDSYTEKTKISIVLLGTAAHLKKSLISVILGRDVFAHKRTGVKFKTHENDTYEVTFTPSVYEDSEAIRRLFSSKRDPDMRLLVVEDGFKTQEVWQQIEKLHEITGKPTKEFTVVLPLGCEPEEPYPFKFYTWDDLFKSLKNMPEKNKKRPAEQPQTPMETDKPPSLLEKENHPDNKVNLVLLGMSGTGKSESGNTILGERQFESKASYMPITTECEAAETEINGTCVRVIDTPDMFDDEIISSDENQHVTQCKQLCQSDPCVYLLVMEVGRFTDGERDILRKVEEAFGTEAKEQTIILFTHGENLQSSRMSFEDFLQDCVPDLSKIVDQCGRRCVVFENQTSGQPQVTELMQTVNEMLDKQQKQ